MLHLVPHLVTQHTARLWLCARAVDRAQLGSISLRVNGIEAPVPVQDWQSFPPARSSAWQPMGAMPLHCQFIDKGALQPDRMYEASASLGDSEPAHARFNTLPEQLGDETKPLRVLLSSCYFTGNKRSRLASSLFAQLDRNGLRPHLRIWAGYRDGVVLLGGTSIVDFRMRVAQSELRQDLLPSFWSSCGLLIDGSVLMTARVDAISNSSARVERNGLEAVKLDAESRYGDSMFYPNIAILQFTDDHAAIREHVARKAGVVEQRVPHKSMSPRQMEQAALALLKIQHKANR